MKNRKCALVTGGSRGLGRVMVLSMLDDGHDVLFTGTDEAATQAVLSEAAGRSGSAQAIVNDLSIAGNAERLADDAVERLGQVDILVNNAGIGTPNIRPDFLTNPYHFWESDRETIDRFFQINAFSGMILANRLVPAMIGRGWGRVIANTTSLDSMLRFTLYGGSKAALEAETAVMAHELAGTGVTANVLVPGGLTGSRMSDMAGIPRDQLFTDDIMIAPIAFLASTASDDFNGRRILACRWPVDGEGREAALAASDAIAWNGHGIPGVFPEALDKI